MQKDDLAFALRKLAEAWWDLALRVELEDPETPDRAVALGAVTRQVIDFLDGIGKAAADRAAGRV